MSVPAMQLARKISAYFYTYSVFFSNLANGSSNTQQVNIQADSNFLVQQLLLGVFAVGGAYQATPNVTLQITDASSGMTLFDRALPAIMIAGSAQLPYLLPTPRTFPASSSISVTATNSDGAARDIYLGFAGQKVARLGA